MKEPFELHIEGFLVPMLRSDNPDQDLDFACFAVFAVEDFAVAFPAVDVCFAEAFFVSGFAAVCPLAFGEDFAADFTADFGAAFPEDLAVFPSDFFAVLFAAALDAPLVADFAAGFAAFVFLVSDASASAVTAGSSMATSVSSAIPWTAAAKQIAVLMIQIRFKNISVS